MVNILAIVSLLIGQILNVVSGDSVDLRVVKYIEVKQQYFVVTKEKPLEVEIEGPATVRFYTRLVMPPDLNQGTYKLILEEDETRQRVIVKETELSKSSRFDNKRVGKWRSFVVDVPEGIHTYRVHLFSADGEAVLVRPVVLRESEWQEVEPENRVKPLELVDGDRSVRVWPIEVGKPIRFELEGNIHAKLFVRLDFDASMGEPQTFSVVVSEGDRVIREKTFRVRKSKTAYYKTKGEVVPSIQKTLNFSLGKGRHTIEIEILSGIAKSASVRLIVSKPKEAGQ